MLQVDNLSVELFNKDISVFNILKDVSISVNKGEIIAILGESGSGKSIFAKTILGLISEPIRKTKGNIFFEGKELLTPNDFASIRGGGISMIMQNPTSSLNPVITIGKQLTESILFHKRAQTAKDAQELAIKMLTETGILYAKDRMNSYPHQLSGGMNQRVMIALTLAIQSKLVIADEPTTALDVITQAQIVNLLFNLSKENLFSTIFISHDISLVEKIADKVYVLYAGELIEIIGGQELKQGIIKHPCTDALKKCLPDVNKSNIRLEIIPGQSARNDKNYNSSCIFYNRCKFAKQKCKESKPEFKDGVKCFFPLQN